MNQWLPDGITSVSLTSLSSILAWPCFLSVHVFEPPRSEYCLGPQSLLPCELDCGKCFLSRFSDLKLSSHF